MITNVSRAPLVASAKNALAAEFISEVDGHPGQPALRCFTSEEALFFVDDLWGIPPRSIAIPVGQFEAIGPCIEAGRKVDRPVASVLHGLGDEVVDQFGAGDPPPPVACQSWCGRGDRTATITG